MLTNISSTFDPWGHIHLSDPGALYSSAPTISQLFLSKRTLWPLMVSFLHWMTPLYIPYVCLRVVWQQSHISIHMCSLTYTWSHNDVRKTSCFFFFALLLCPSLYFLIILFLLWFSLIYFSHIFLPLYLSVYLLHFCLFLFLFLF